jgi:stage II sporulation protein AB (anti-sigma F factor)
MKARSQNEAFARIAAAAFVSAADPVLSDVTDIKTAVSEAVTNAIIHGYASDPARDVRMTMRMDGGDIYIEVSDDGAGIEDVALARQPLYTSRPELERSGMGFTVMEAFMDSVEVESSPGGGTRVIMRKRLSG